MIELNLEVDISMLDTSYIFWPISEVKHKDRDTLFKTKLPEMISLRSIVNQVRLLFKVPSTCIKLGVIDEKRIYRIGIYTNDTSKSEIAFFFYIPLEKRLDLYEPGNAIPILQWKSRRCVFKGISPMYQKIELEKLFMPVVNVTL